MEKELKETDIVVFNEVTSTLGVFAPLLEDGDELRLPTKEELDLYNKRPET